MSRRHVVWTLTAAAALVLPSVNAFTSLHAVAAAAVKPHCAPAKSAGGDWPMYGHDLANTRNQPDEHKIGVTNVSTLHKAWEFNTQQAGGSGDFTSTPVIVDGCVFVGSTNGWMFAINADTGQTVWATEVDKDGSEITDSAFVTGGRVYIAVGRSGSPYVAALSEKTGKVLWTTVTDTQDGADAYGSPVVYDGYLFEGVSGGAAELGDETERDNFQGAYEIFDTQGKNAGKMIKKVFTIHAPYKNQTQGGATVWATPALDTVHKMLYVGTGNPFHAESQPDHSDAILKIDFNPRSPKFGDIVNFYDGTVETYTPVAQTLPCYDFPGNPPPYYPQGLGECAQLDMDFGASVNLIHGPHGATYAGEGQKSGVYHLVNTANMKLVWKTVVGPPSDFGGVVGSTAYDGKNIYGPLTIGGYDWSLNAQNGMPRWVAPVGDGAHWGDPVATANGIVYTVGLTGFLDAFDSATGTPLLHHPMAADVNTGDVAASWGGVSVARNTVYATVGMTGLPNGYIIAYKPGIDLTSVAKTAKSMSVTPTAGPTVVSVAQAEDYGYATPVMVVKKGGELQYVNFDIVRHDVVQDPSKDHIANKRKSPWCKLFAKNRCPLFYSPLIGLDQSERVLGISNLKPGTYSFYCTLHPGMTGKLIVEN